MENEKISLESCFLLLLLASCDPTIFKKVINEEKEKEEENK